MPAELIGRNPELDIATAVLDRLEAGPAALVLEGEAGIGKTMLWRAVVGAAAERGVTVLATRPAEPEANLAFGVLSDLLRDVDETIIGGLPVPQRRALEVALLCAEPAEADGDPRAVPAATVSVLRELAARGPVLLALDDAQWVDSASATALAYAIRRLGEVRVGLLAAVRIPGAGAAIDLEAALPQGRVHRLRVGPMSVGALHHLIEARLGHAPARPLLVRIAEAAAGNPFHVLEISRALDERGGHVAGAPLPVPAAIRDLARDRVRLLPSTARAALLRVAALSRPTTALVDARDLLPAEAAGIVEIHLDGRIEFSHSLFAAAVYGDAPSTDRRAVHRALASVVPDLEERARHEALAATGPDESVARLLTDAAGRARARGATAIAAELVQLALWLTPPDAADDRFRREARLAQYLSLAGQPAHAESLLRAAIRGAPAGDARDEAQITLALICRETDQGRAVTACEDALAGASSPAVVARAHATLGLLLEGVDVDRAAAHSAAAAASFAAQGNKAGWSYAVMGHCWHRLLAGHGADARAFAEALEVQSALPADDRWRSGTPSAWALAHDDLATARARFAELGERARNRGDECDVAWLTGITAQIDCWRGDTVRASEVAAEALETARLCGSPAALADVIRISANIDAVRGRLDRARAALGPGIATATSPDEGRFVYATASVLGFVAWSAGDAHEADEQFRRATVALDRVGMRETPGYRYLGDHVEAILALGDIDRAEGLVAQLDRRASVLARPWTLAVGARCRGLVLASRGELDRSLAAFEAALVHHEGLDSPFELGRTLLAKAQVHRRRTEKRLARDTLERAVSLFEACGAEVWAERARSELGRIRFRAAPTEITETELRIAELAATGRTNREIARTVYVSPKTVETRLASVYGKLGIRSRAELGAWMAARAAASPAMSAGA